MKLRELVDRIQLGLGIKHSRTKNISEHVFKSFLYKGGGILANLLLVPLSIAFLDTENYGVWLTLSSFIGWFTFFDIGLGHGLRNKFAEAKSQGDSQRAKGYVSTAYFTIGAIGILFLLFSLAVSYLIDWTVVFNTSNSLKAPLQLLMPIVFGSFALRLFFTLIISIYTADQNHSIQSKVSFITAVGSLVLIWFITYTTKSSLLLFGILFSVFPVLVLIGLHIYGFSTKFEKYRPKFKYVKKAYFRDIFGLGVSFFVIQISMIAMFSTDNFIITQLFNPQAVVPYNIAYKYLGLGFMVFDMILMPYWSTITVAYGKGETKWIKNAVNNLIKISIGAVVLIFIMALVSPFMYEVWLGELVTVPLSLTLMISLYFVIVVLYSPFNYFINGIGKIKLHMYSFGIGALLNIPLSIFLVRYLGMGVEGVMLASIICISPNLLLFPIQYYRIINNTATGIWNK